MEDYLSNEYITLFVRNKGLLLTSTKGRYVCSSFQLVVSTEYEKSKNEKRIFTEQKKNMKVNARRQYNKNLQHTTAQHFSYRITRLSVSPLEIRRILWIPLIPSDYVDLRDFLSNLRTCRAICIQSAQVPDICVYHPYVPGICV